VNKPVLSLKQQQLKAQFGSVKAVQQPVLPASRQPQHAVPAPPPTPPQQKPSPEPAPPKPKESKPLDVAEQFLCDARRDNAPVEITFTDGSALAGRPAWVGTYSVRVRLDDGTEAVAFMRREVL
jgi:sRNA-binding regulator protein Hfq